MDIQEISSVCVGTSGRYFMNGNLQEMTKETPLCLVLLVFYIMIETYLFKGEHVDLPF